MSGKRFDRRWLSVLLATVLGGACAEDEPHVGTEADQLGVGAQCQTHEQCELYIEDGSESEYMLRCLDLFKGGYCGIIDCKNHDDCPEGSGCVSHDDGFKYCFGVCVDKADCNINRNVDLEANCSANITWSGPELGKACVPPEGS